MSEKEVKKCGDCEHFDRKDHYCAYKEGFWLPAKEPACDLFAGAKEISDILREAETVPVVAEQAETEQNAAYWMNKVLESAHEAWENLHNTADFKKAIEQADAIKEQLGIAEHDAVSHPAHYTSGGIECIDCIKAALGENFMGFLIGNVIKYSYRYRNKNGLEDLKKARWYLDRAIKEIGDERTE